MAPISVNNIEIVEQGERFYLLQDKFCYRILTREGAQVFGSYSLQAAKAQFNKLENK